MDNLVGVKSVKNILIVEDDELSGRLLQSILIKGGYKVEVCVQGSDAIQRLESSSVQVDLILTDIMMPLMGGFDFIAHIKKNGASTHFMVITSLKDKATMEKAKTMGAVDYITKPYKSSDVITRVNQFFLDHASEEDRIVNG